MKPKLESIPCTFSQIYAGNVFEDKDDNVCIKIDEIIFKPYRSSGPVMPANAVSLGDSSLRWYKQGDFVKCITINNIEE